MDNDAIIKLCKEKEGLKLGYEKYKHKYKKLRNIVRDKLSYKIDGLKTQERQFLFRLKNTQSEQEQETLKALIRFIRKEREELELIYAMCNEIDR